MNCTICEKPVTLMPSATERARRFGGSPADYTKLFPTHAECAIQKRSEETAALMRRLRREREGMPDELKGHL